MEGKRRQLDLHVGVETASWSPLCERQSSAATTGSLLDAASTMPWCGSVPRRRGVE